jgi:predicted nucleotidyltransferase
MPLGLPVDHQRLADLCRRFRVAKLELFGSRAKGTARPDSDVDLLVNFEPGYTPGWELGGLFVELGDLLGRKVDLITQWTLEHEQSPRFRANVLASTELLYAA